MPRLPASMIGAEALPTSFGGPNRRSCPTSNRPIIAARRVARTDADLRGVAIRGPLRDTVRRFDRRRRRSGEADRTVQRQTAAVSGSQSVGDTATSLRRYPAGGALVGYARRRAMATFTANAASAAYPWAPI